MVRYGEAAAGFTEDVDPALSELGQTQANAAARSLQSRCLGAALLTSPKRRAIQTGDSALRQRLPFRSIRGLLSYPRRRIEARKPWLQEVLRELGVRRLSLFNNGGEIVAAIQALQTPV